MLLDRKISFVAVLALFGSLSCQDTNFVHYNEDLLPPPPPFSQSFAIKEIGQSQTLDILWVIDNSGSMGGYQQAVIKNTDLFMQKFIQKKFLDWKMGLLSSDVNNSPFVGFTPSSPLNFETPNGVGVFQNAVAQLGIRGSGQEQFFEPMHKHLSAFPGFSRKDSILSIIIVTDTGDQSRMSTKDFVKFLSTIKPNLDKVRPYLILAAPDLGCSGSEGQSYARSKFEELTNTLKGKVFKLCDDFAKSISDIGDDMVSFLQSSRIYLNTRPKTETIQVLYKGNELKRGLTSEGGVWIYDPVENAIFFHNLDFSKSELDTVQIKYELDVDRRPQ